MKLVSQRDKEEDNSKESRPSGYMKKQPHPDADGGEELRNLCAMKETGRRAAPCVQRGHNEHIFGKGCGLQDASYHHAKEEEEGGR